MSHDLPLAPCPFCGAYDVEICESIFTAEEAAEEGWTQTVFYIVACDCGATHGEYPGHETQVAAAAMWNMRSPGALDG